MISLIGILAYIAYAEMLFYISHAWQLITLTAVIVVLVYSITGMIACLRLNAKPGLSQAAYC